MIPESSRFSLCPGLVLSNVCQSGTSYSHQRRGNCNPQDHSKVDNLWGICWTGHWCTRVQPTGGGTTPEQVVLCCRRKQGRHGEWAFLHGSFFSSHHQIPALSCCSGYLWSWSETQKCKPNKPSPPPSWSGLCFITATEKQAWMGLEAKNPTLIDYTEV